MSNSPYYFDQGAVDVVLAFFRKYLRQTKGRWAGQPFDLMPWELDIITNVFGWKRKEDGTRRYRTVYIEVPKKSGKALALDTPIPTPSGWSEMGSLSVGDEVFDENGNICRVTNATEVMEGHACYKVVFSDGQEIVADAQHLWKTEAWRAGGTHGVKRKPEDDIHTTEQIRQTLHVGNPYDLEHGIVTNNHSIRVCGALKTEEQELPVDPYVFGAWLGDGDSDSARITCHEDDAQTLEEISKLGYSVKKQKSHGGRTQRYLVGSGGRSQKERSVCLQAKLREMGVLKNKIIPTKYLRASEEQRLELLRGIMDTDGYVSKAGRLELVTVSGQLFDSYLELIRSLGYKPTTTIDRAKINGKDCGPRYRIRFSGYSDRPVFKLRRKVDRLPGKPTRKIRSRYRHIVAVEPVESVPVRCIEVDSPSHMYLAGDGMIATHNSPFASGLALYLLCADGEPGAEVYSAAADRQQAGIVYEMARQMVLKSPDLKRILEPMKHSIFHKNTTSIYRALSHESGTVDGINASGIIIDELHRHKKRDLYDVLVSSTAARLQPLTIIITTAGWDRTSICWEVHEKAQRVIKGDQIDDEFYPVIYGADLEDDWTDPEVWRKANPSLGVTVQESYLKTLCDDAIRIPGKQNAFKRYHLNMWTEQSERWIDIADWDACGDPDIELEAMRGESCFLGIDLASRRDLTAVVLLFPPKKEDDPYILIPRFYMPEANIQRRVEDAGVPYRGWVDAGYIIPTPGNIIDFDYVRQHIDIMAMDVDVMEIAIDPHNATQLTTQLQDGGYKIHSFSQYIASMSGPMKELERLLIGRMIEHDANPVLRWMVGNVAPKEDADGRIKPDRSRSAEKIDGVVSTIMALGRAIEAEAAEGPSVYEERGIREL